MDGFTTGPQGSAEHELGGRLIVRAPVDHFRVAFKPTATIMTEQRTVTAAGEDTTIAGRGRHDPCVLPRAVPMVEAMAALVFADHALRQTAITPP